MKKLIYILLFVPFIVNGQVTTNRGFYWTGSMDWTDSTLVDDDGNYNNAVKLHNVTDTSLDYLSMKSKLMISYSSDFLAFAQDAADTAYFSDTTYIVCHGFYNLNYSNIAFFKKEAQTVGTDSLTILPQRITEIAIYSTPSGDASTYYNDVDFDTTGMVRVGVDGDYTTIAAAVTAGSSDDTLLIDGGYYQETRTYQYLWLDKGIYLMGIAPVELVSNTGDEAYVLAFAGALTAGGAENFYINTNTDDRAVNAPNPVTLKNCYMKGGDVSVIRLNHATSQAIVKNSVLSTVNNFSDISKNFLISECYLTGTSTGDGFTLQEGVRCEMVNSIIDASFADLFYLYDDNLLELRYNKFDINSAANSIVELRNVDAVQDVIVKGNDMNCSIQFSDEPFEFVSNYFSKDLIFINNDVDFTHASHNKALILVNNADSVVIEGNDINISSESNPATVDAYNTTAGATDFISISENDFTIENESGYGVKIGTENTGSYDDSFSLIYIDGNEFFADLTTSNTTHGIFVGHNINPYIRWNKEENFDLGIVHKHSDGTNTSGFVGYNTLHNTNILCFGSRKEKIYNNTVYLGGNANTIGINVGTNTTAPDSSEIYNNIIYAADNAYTYYLLSVNDTSYIFSDYNLLYQEGGTEALYINGVSKTSTEFQAAGFDANSIFDENPRFYSSTRLWPVMVRWTGKDLIGYKTGLLPGTLFGDEEITNNTQFFGHQLGAYTHDIGILTLPASNSININGVGVIDLNKGYYYGE